MGHATPVVISILLGRSEGGVEDAWCAGALHHIGEIVDVGCLGGVVNDGSVRYRAQGENQNRSSRGTHCELKAKNRVSRRDSNARRAGLFLNIEMKNFLLDTR
jgi:hypothetical protein